jgi:hypothetical protein
VATKTFDVGRVDSARLGGDSLCELEQFTGRVIQSSGTPTDRESINRLLIVDLIPEVV